MVLYRDLTFEGAKETRKLKTLFDGGASHSRVRQDIAETLTIPIPLKNPLKLYAASEGHEIKFRAALDFYREDFRLSDEFLVAPSLSEDVIIGASTMRKRRIKLNFEADAIETPPTGKTAILK